MAKMRRELAVLDDDEIGDVITYGCSAHLLNLFSKDIEADGNIKKKVKNIIKYFKYHHFPAAKYKEAGGKALVIPQDTRWNTLADCLESYTSNWHCLEKVCTEYKPILDLTIARSVQNIELKENVEIYLTKLKKISVALNRVQKEMCVISECTDIWKTLLSLEWSQEEQNKLIARYHTAMTPAHFAAYLLDPKYNGVALTEEEETLAMEFIESHGPQVMRDVLAYRAKTFPFKEYLFKDALLKITHVSL
ncbi:unnamed protein product [Euphydryas editha]|uniref:Uncharacterized protein n=1 Tax=Euphydryas editha TaxID=104508 RepID=A0AAU9TLB2_EUPED|nr:unnamed protein product [Euphydryas editha]